MSTARGASSNGNTQPHACMLLFRTTAIHHTHRTSNILPCAYVREVPTTAGALSAEPTAGCVHLTPAQVPNHRYTSVKTSPQNPNRRIDTVPHARDYELLETTASPDGAELHPPEGSPPAGHAKLSQSKGDQRQKEGDREPRGSDVAAGAVEALVVVADV